MSCGWVTFNIDAIQLVWVIGKFDIYKPLNVLPKKMAIKSQDWKCFARFIIPQNIPHLLNNLYSLYLYWRMWNGLYIVLFLI